MYSHITYIWGYCGIIVYPIKSQVRLVTAKKQLTFICSWNLTWMLCQVLYASIDGLYIYCWVLNIESLIYFIYFWHWFFSNRNPAYYFKLLSWEILNSTSATTYIDYILTKNTGVKFIFNSIFYYYIRHHLLGLLKILY